MIEQVTLNQLLMLVWLRVNACLKAREEMDLSVAWVFVSRAE
jgi:hypothetical protein